MPILSQPHTAPGHFEAPRPARSLSVVHPRQPRRADSLNVRHNRHGLAVPVAA